MADSRNQYKKRGVDYDVSEKMVGLPRRYYNDPLIYREELAKIFSQRWLLACREEEIPEPGDFITIQLGGESIILLCGRDGQLCAHFNVCRHRGTRLCSADHGHFDHDTIRCPYHSWGYDLDGNLKAAPEMSTVPAFNKHEYNLLSANLELWGGFVFINLAEQPRPFEEEMGSLFGKFDDWAMPDLRIAHHQPYTLNCNWKFVLQNYQECYHCPGVHPLLAKRTPFRSAVHDCFEGAVIGGYMELKEAGGSMTMDGESAGPSIGSVTGDDLQRVYYYSIFPNVLLSPHPDFVLYHQVWPLAIDKVRIDCCYLLHPEVIADSEAMARFQSAIDFWDMTNRQDWEVCEQMQLGTRSERFERGLYAPSEDILFALDREILNALGHMG